LSLPLPVNTETGSVSPTALSFRYSDSWISLETGSGQREDGIIIPFYIKKCCQKFAFLKLGTIRGGNILCITIAGTDFLWNQRYWSRSKTHDNWM